MADVPGARVTGHISIVNDWKEPRFYTTSIMTAKDFCGTVRYRIIKADLSADSRKEKRHGNIKSQLQPV